MMSEELKEAIRDFRHADRRRLGTCMREIEEIYAASKVTAAVLLNDLEEARLFFRHCACEHSKLDAAIETLRKVCNATKF